MCGDHPAKRDLQGAKLDAERELKRRTNEKALRERDARNAEALRLAHVSAGPRLRLHT
jgi:hypothetical protein